MNRFTINRSSVRNNANAAVPGVDRAEVALGGEATTTGGGIARVAVLVLCGALASSSKAQCVGVGPGAPVVPSCHYLMRWPFSVSAPCFVSWTWKKRCPGATAWSPAGGGTYAYPAGSYNNEIASTVCAGGQEWRLEWSVQVNGITTCTGAREDLVLPAGATIVAQPSSQSTCRAAPATFSVGVGGSADPITYRWQWRREGSTAWVNVTNGLNTSPPPDPPGLAAFMATGATSAHMTASPGGAGWVLAHPRREFRVVATNPCGSATSEVATLTICPSDFDDGNGAGACDGGVDINDLLYFLGIFELGEPSGDLDDGNGQGVPDGGVDINDLLFFLAHFEAGC